MSLRDDVRDEAKKQATTLFGRLWDWVAARMSARRARRGKK